MKNIIDKYINKMQNGLFLLDAPTGYGKTWSVIQYINGKIIEEPNSFNHIFYVTNMKKNIDMDNFQKILGENFDKYCIFLRPYYEHVIENFDKVKIEDEKITKSEHYLNLKSAIDNLQFTKNDKNLDFTRRNRIIKVLEGSIEKDLEPKFREYIKKQFFYNKKSYEKQQYIKQNEWIQKLYPSTTIDRFKVILTSTNKFLTPLDPFYKLPYFFYNNEILENSIVFIDEFDAAKPTILEKIISEGIKYKNDIIKMFINIYFALKNVSFPKALLKKAEVKTENKNYHSIKEILDKNLEVFEKIYTENEMNYLIKSRDLIYNKAFLFSDGNYITVISDKSRKRLKSKLDISEAQRIIYPATKKDPNKNLSYLMSEIEYAINYFTNGITWISKSYQKNKNDNNTKKSSNYFSNEEAIRSILSIFHLSQEYMDYLFERISTNIVEKNYYMNETDKEERFLKKGLSFIEVEDSDYHDMQSVLHKFNFDTTPEQMLLRICSKSKVVGISATATLETVIGNFNLNYLEKELESNYYKIEQNDILKMKKDFEKAQLIYEQKDINVNIELVDNFPYINEYQICRELIMKIFDGENQKKYLTILTKLNSRTCYYYLIALKIAFVYKSFAQNEKMFSFLCFINRFPKYSSHKLSFEELNQKDIKMMLKDIYDTENIFFLNSKQFEEEIDGINQKLNRLEKCFVITTYQTLGCGKNIQYDIPNGIEKNMIIVDRSRMQKDYDGIFLLTPTNLIQNVNADAEDKYSDVSRFLFHQEYLFSKGYIDSKKKATNIISAFKTLYFPESFTVFYRNNGDLFLNNARVIIQAVGRICRCPNKNKDIYIFTDAECLERLQDVKEELKSRILNYEFFKLLQYEFERINLNCKLYSEKNKKIKNALDSMAENVRQSIYNVKQWEKLRDAALRNPTYTGNNSILDEYYFEFDKPINMYGYKFSKNFEIKNIVFRESYNYNKVSSLEAGLNALWEIECVKKVFMEKNYSFKFQMNTKIMSPAFFKQIYQAAIGEVAGKAILEENMGDDLKPLDDYTMYEFFDYKYENIYIDFKNWNRYEIDNDTYVRKIMWKLNSIKGSKAIIINILKVANGKELIQNLPQNVIQIPWLINDENEIDETQIETVLKFMNL